MITRRRLFGWGTAIVAAANTTKVFALGLPRWGFAAQLAKSADALTGALKGKIYYKGDPAYEIQRRGATFNARKPNRFPSAIVLAENVDDVIGAVKLAKERGWQVSTRSGGHSFTGSHTRENAVMINISKMKELSVDPKARIAKVSPAWLGDQFNRVLAEQYQLMFPTAHDPGVGLGGFVMCGGHGLNSRLWGPGCANLQALDVVTADGELIHADENQNSDFLWAARGSGPGFFGVAVRYYLNLHPLPTSRKSSIYTFSPDVLDELATWLGNTQNSFPRFLESILIGGTADGKPALTLAGNSLGYSEKEVDEALDLLESAPVAKKAASRHVRVPFATGGAIKLGTQQILDGVWTSAPPDKILSAGRDAFLKFPTPQSFMLWLHWGPVQKLKDMAYSLQGDVYLSPNAIYYDAADDERCAAWSAGIMDKLKPISNGSQMNDENMPSNKGPYLSREAAARLETMRAKYDPERRFASFLA
jgi:FAD/FMN-containing dehydrogenase